MSVFRETLLSSVGLGGHAQHIQDAAVFFVVLGHGRGQFVTHLVPERFNALPERRAKQRVEQITAQRERHQFGGRGRDLVRTLRARSQLPDFAALSGVHRHVDARGLQRLQIPPHAARVQRRESEVRDEFVTNLFQRATEPKVFEDLQNLVLANKLFIACHGAPRVPIADQ